SSHSINICPPHSPTRTTKNSILKLAGAFHWPNTSRIRFWAFSYSIGEPCGRSNQLMMYFIYSPFGFQMVGSVTTAQVYSFFGLVEKCGNLSGQFLVRSRRGSD